MSLNARSSGELPALHTAAFHAHPEAVHMLMAHGADCTVRARGRTPLHYACASLDRGPLRADVLRALLSSSTGIGVIDARVQIYVMLTLHFHWQSQSVCVSVAEFFANMGLWMHTSLHKFELHFNHDWLQLLKVRFD